MGLPYTTFSNWMDAKPGASLPGNMVAKLVERTGLSYDNLFVHFTEKPARRRGNGGKPT